MDTKKFLRRDFGTLIFERYYTKGIEERFRAIERLFEREPGLIGRFTFLQIASPSRTLIERYGQLNRDVEQLADRINARFSRDNWKPIALKRQHTDWTCSGFYRAYPYWRSWETMARKFMGLSLVCLCPASPNGNGSYRNPFLASRESSWKTKGTRSPYITVTPQIAIKPRLRPEPP